MQETQDLYDSETNFLEKSQELARFIVFTITKINICQDAINQYCKDNGLEPPAESKMYHNEEFLLDFLEKLENKADKNLQKARREAEKLIKDKSERDKYFRDASYKNGLAFAYKI